MKLVDQVRSILKASKESKNKRTAEFLEKEYDSFLEEVRKDVYKKIVEAAQRQFEEIYFNFHPCNDNFMEHKTNYHIFSLNKDTVCQRLQKDIIRYLKNEGFQVEIDQYDNYEIRVSWMDE